MCKYCEFNKEKYYGKKILTEGRFKDLRFEQQGDSYYITSHGEIELIYVQINYCPFCGMKLNKKEDKKY